MDKKPTKTVEPAAGEAVAALAPAAAQAAQEPTPAPTPAPVIYPAAPGEKVLKMRRPEDSTGLEAHVPVSRLAEFEEAGWAVKHGE